MFSRYASAILLVILCLCGMLCSDVMAGVTIENDSVHIQYTSYLANPEIYNKVQDSVPWFSSNPYAWNPGDTSACSPNQGTFAGELIGAPFYHFKILDSAGTCMILNRRLTPSPDSVGSYKIDMAFPINQILVDSDFVFYDSSYFDGFGTEQGYYEADTVEMKGDQSYSFVITWQYDAYQGGPAEFADMNRTVLYIECCDGFRGNVDDDPEEKCQLADLTLLISYLNSGTELPCPTEADVDGDGDIDWDDFDYLNAYIYLNGPAPASCP